MAEVLELLEKEAIETVPSHEERDGFYCTFFVVPKKGSPDLRPILNLKPLNAFIQTTHFKMENIRTIKKALQPRDYVATVDLRDAYMHVAMFKDHRKFLRFKIAGQAYQFRVLPFGLATAPRVFTKMMAPLVAHARLQGIHIYPYLDDWLLRHQDPDQLQSMVVWVLNMLAHHGLVVNVQKSKLTPSQEVVFIGGHFQTVPHVVSLPQDRIDSLVIRVREFISRPVNTARQCLVLLGTMNACTEVVQYARLHMRPIQLYLLYHWRPKTQPLNMPIPISQIILPHLEWWLNPVNLQKGVCLKEPEIQETLFSDASDKGWGGHLESGGQVQGQWHGQMNSLSCHINLRELEAVFLVSQHFEPQLVNKHILIRCDNATVVAYLNNQGGTKSPSLCMRAWTLLQWFRARNITFKAVHIQGSLNIQADYLSRVFAKALEWQLHRPVVQQLFMILDRPHIDLFATQHNNQIPVFCSRYQDPLAYHVDSLQLNWDMMFGYAFPPISLIPLVLDKVRKHNCVVILVAPRWPRRSWYPQILDLLVEIPVALPKIPNLLSQDRGRLIHPKPQVFELVAWKLSARDSLQKAFHKKLSVLCYNQSDQVQDRLMMENGKYSQVGVKGGLSIPIQLL